MVATSAVGAAAPDRSPWPVARPGDNAERPSAAIFVQAAPGLRRSLRPTPRPAPDRLAQVTRPQTSSILPIPKTIPNTQKTGLFSSNRICNSKNITGTRVNPIQGQFNGCSILNPVKVTAVHGVQLTRPLTVDCPTARALADWVENGAWPAFGKRGGGLAVVQVIGSYSCRTRNSQPGAKLSEHARGRAIDISGFRMANGDTYSVQNDWRRGAKGRILRKIHALACGTFGTVLGPNADQYHQSHFHLDTANYRGGKAYCR